MAVSEIMDVELDVVDDSEIQAASAGKIDFPCVVLSGVTTEEELQFFRKRKYDDECSLPLYLDVDGAAYLVGRLDLTLDSLLSLRSVFPYTLRLYTDEGSHVPIDLNDAETLMKFIKL